MEIIGRNLLLVSKVRSFYCMVFFEKSLVWVYWQPPCVHRNHFWREIVIVLLHCLRNFQKTKACWFFAPGFVIFTDIRFFLNVLLTAHLSISLDNDQLDAHLLYFTIRPLQSSTCFDLYMLIIRRLNYIDAASGIVTLSQWPSGAHVLSLSTCAQEGHWLRGRYQMLHQYNSTFSWWACNARNM